MRSAKLWLFAIPLLLAVVAWGSEVGSISGVVTDSSGAAVPRATATVKNLDTAVTRSVTTNDVGAYAFLALPVGRYELSVSASGFGTFQRTDIVLNTNDELRFDVILKIGGVTGTVEVAADALHVETANTQLGDVISGTQMENIPLNGRQYTDLLALQPGVAPGASTQTSTYNQYFGTTETGSISVSGQRETSNGFFVNGTSVNDTLNNGTTVVPNLDSIAEFRILTSNFDAEYGNYSGGLVTVVTKSGTNILHGDVFDYLRNTDLDARSFFDAARNAFSAESIWRHGGRPDSPRQSFLLHRLPREPEATSASRRVRYRFPRQLERGGDFSSIAAELNMTGKVSGPYFADILTSELGYPVTSGESYYTSGCTSSAACVFPEWHDSDGGVLGAGPGSPEVHPDARPEWSVCQQREHGSHARRSVQRPGRFQHSLLGHDLCLLFLRRQSNPHTFWKQLTCRDSRHLAVAAPSCIP